MNWSFEDFSKAIEMVVSTIKTQHPNFKINVIYEPLNARIFSIIISNNMSIPSIVECSLSYDDFCYCFNLYDVILQEVLNAVESISYQIKDQDNEELDIGIDAAIKAIVKEEAYDTTVADLHFNICYAIINGSEKVTIGQFDRGEIHHRFFIAPTKDPVILTSLISDQLKEFLSKDLAGNWDSDVKKGGDTNEVISR